VDAEGAHQGRCVEIDRVYPLNSGGVAEGGQIVLLGRYVGSGRGEASVLGQRGGTDVVIPCALTFPSAADGRDEVARLWAKARVDALVRLVRRGKETVRTKEEVLTLALKHGFVTPYTSFLAMPEVEQEWLERRDLASRERMRASWNPGTGAASVGDADVKHMTANLEALTLEFADELALLNVKYTKLASELAEVRQRLSAVPERRRGVSRASASSLFTGVASFALVDTDGLDGPAPVGPQRTRFTTAGQTYFTMPKVSLGTDVAVTRDVRFTGQFDLAAELNGAVGTMAVNEAYFMLQDRTRLGAFALPFTQEVNSPLRTLNDTVTPSAVGTFLEQWRVFGAEQTVRRLRGPEFRFAVVSGTDGPVSGWTPQLLGRMDDTPVAANSNELDDGFGWYVQARTGYRGLFGRQDVTARIGWFDNGGDGLLSADLRFWHAAAQWRGDELRILAGYLAGDGDLGPTSADFAAWYLTARWDLSARAWLTVRYDDWRTEVVGAPFVDGSAYTVALGRRVTTDSILQLEWLSPDEPAAGPGGADMNDDLVQVRYRVHF